MFPVLLEPLHRCGYPQLDDLAEDLHCGFSTVGALHSGVGWWPRLDGKYQHPLDLKTFHTLNYSYVQHRLGQGHVDENWEAMLQELLEDRFRGRLEGRFLALQHWMAQTVGIPGEALLEAPSGPVYAAFCFSVQQNEKIRRCEDHRRSFHNDTISVADVPHHDTIDAYTRLSLWWLRHSPGSVSVWAHDLDSASYRQLGVRNTDYSYVVLQTPRGAMVFRHTALCFGSTASVWSFNRFADSLVFLTHHLLITPCLHYVDDFGGIEPSSSATSAFNAFADFFKCLGLKTKDKKAEPPNCRQKLLGVIIEVEEHGVRLSPCPVRLAKIKEEIHRALVQNTLTPEEAQRLSGKLVFLQSTCFGQMGKAPLQCLYSRAVFRIQTLDHCVGGFATDIGNHAAGAAAKMVSRGRRQVWTDAYFAPGDSPYKHSKAKKEHTASQVVENGWGFVLSCSSGAFFAHGTIPNWAMRPFTTRRAFIYFLEAITPVIATVLMRDLLSQKILAFIDNQASLQAFKKGYGRDMSVNGLLCFFWSFVARRQLTFAMEWVPSHLNISDPVSRHDCSIAERLGWTEAPALMDQLYQILVKCSRDLVYAAGEAVDNCLRLSPAFRQLHLVHGGGTGTEMVRKGPPCGASSSEGRHAHQTTGEKNSRLNSMHPALCQCGHHLRFVK